MASAGTLLLVDDHEPTFVGIRDLLATSSTVDTSDNRMKFVYYRRP